VISLVDRSIGSVKYAHAWATGGYKTFENATPISGTHLSARWRDSEFIHYRPEGVALSKLDTGPALPKAASAMVVWRLFAMVGYLDDYLGVVIGFPLAHFARAKLKQVGSMCGLIWNTEKWDLGAPACVFEFLGVIFNLADLDKPFVQQPEKKRTELHHLVKLHLASHSATVTELNSLSGRLLNAAKVVRHGRLHVTGVLAAVRCPPDAKGAIPLGRWCLRDLAWWSAYYEAGGDGRCFLRPAPSYPGLAQSDASGIGYGGFWIDGTTIFYFHGTWGQVQPTNLTLEADVNVLELATAVWLVELAGPTFADHCVEIDCDNMQSVVVADSFKTRREAMSLLLERLDATAAVHHIDARLKWLAGESNGPADALSRDNLQAFFDLMNAFAMTTHTSYTFQDVTSRLDHQLFSVVESLSSARGSNPPRGIATRQL
jgi:hypothetical protein